MRSLRLMAPALLCLPLAACGGGGDAKTPEIVNPTPQDLSQTAYVELARGLYVDYDPGAGGKPVLSAGQSRCVARKLVDDFGVKGLTEIHVLSQSGAYLQTPGAIPADEADRWIAGFDGCVDLHDFVFDTVKVGASTVNPDAVKASDDATWEKARACVHEKVSDAEIHAALQEQLTSKPVKGADSSAFDACLRIAYDPKPGKSPAAN